MFSFFEITSEGRMKITFAYKMHLVLRCVYWSQFHRHVIYYDANKVHTTLRNLLQCLTRYVRCAIDDAQHRHIHSQGERVLKTHAPTEWNVIVHLIGSVIIQAQHHNDTNFGTRRIDRIGLILCQALRVVNTKREIGGNRLRESKREVDWTGER